MSLLSHSVKSSAKLLAFSCRSVVCPVKTFPVQAAFICSKALQDPTVIKPPPFPYKEKKFNNWTALWDVNTSSRFDENTKLIVVEGNVGSGKTDFAKQIANELGMLYVPEANLDAIYINDYGFDYRQLDNQLPENVQTYDLQKFYANPNHANAALFQINMYKVRYMQHIDVLAHILNTGQGVIMERCVYSDFVFLETMVKMGYISRPARNAYYQIKKNTISELMRPHLVIYLDAPVDVLLQRIKKRGRNYEINTKVLTKEYLKAIEEFYKQRYLKEISQHAEVLVYDWTNFGDVESIVEDIERIDFTRFDLYSTKMEDWNVIEDKDWKERRYLYSTRKDSLMMYFNVPIFDVPELLMSGDEKKLLIDSRNAAPGNKYAAGYNADMGDSNLLFKTKKAYNEKAPIM